MTSERPEHPDSILQDVLLSRGVGGDAAPAEWDRIADEAIRDHGFAAGFVLRARDEALVRALVLDAERISARVETGDRVVVGATAGGWSGDRTAGRGRRHESTRPDTRHWMGSPPGESFHDASSRRSMGAFGGWAGWLVAAAMFFAWTQMERHETRLPDDARPIAQHAGLGGTAEEALRAYLDRGRAEKRVIDELPDRLLVETRPVSDGTGFEVIYVRQFVERAIVPDLYRFGGQNELGQPSLVRLAPSRPVSM